MATEVDNRVVQMTFNNAQFEKGVDKTLKTIDKLNKALKFQDASEGFDEIQNAANSVSLSKISDQISTLSDKFSGLGIVGMTIWTKIGDAAWDFVTGPFRAVENAISNAVNAVTNQVKTGGWNRAANLEQAKFLIEGLGYAWEKGAGETLEKEGKEVANIYNIVDEAVTGTAYSLDEAAKAAGNLLASGINAEDGGLLGTLNAITGLAATTSSEFSHVADIFSKVAGQGRVMGDDLNRISTLGINAAAKLAEALETDQATIRDMVSKGQIDFETFANVMEYAFGEQAQRANDSFTGSLSNVKSALSRIGARVAEPLLNGLIKPLNEARVLINEVGKALDNSGLTQFINDFIGDSSKKIASMFVTFEEDGSIKLKESTQAFFDSLTMWFTGFDRMFKSALKLVRIFGQAFNNVFGSKKTKEYSTGMNKFTEYFDKLNHRLWKDEGLINKVRKGFETFLKVVKLFLTVFKAVFTIATKVVKIFLKLLKVVVKLGATIASLIVDFAEWFKTTKTYKNIVEVMTKASSTFLKTLDFIITKVKEGAEKFVNFIKTSDKVKKTVKALAEGFKKAGSIFYNVLKKAGSELRDAFKTAAKFVKESDLIQKALSVVSNIFEKVKGTAKDALEFIKDKIENFSFSEFKDDLVEFFTGTLPDKIHEFGETLAWAFAHPNQCIKLLIEKFGQFKSEIGDKLTKSVQDAEGMFSNFGGKVDAARGKLRDFINDDSVDPDKAKEKFSIFDVLSNALQGLADSLSFLIEVLANAGKGLWDAILTGFSYVAQYVDNMTLEEFLNLIAYGAEIFKDIEWGKAGSEIAGFFKTVEKSFGGNTLAKTLNSVPRGLLMVAGALALMAMSVKTLSNIDEKSLRKAMATIFAIAIALKIIIKAISSLKTDTGKLSKGSDGGNKKEKKGLFGKIADAIANNVGNSATITSFAIFLAGIGVAVYKVIKAVSLIAKTADELDDSDKMIGAVVTVAIFFAGITWALGYLMEKLKQTCDTVGEGEDMVTLRKSINPKVLTGLAAFIFAFGTAMLELSGSVLILSAIPLDLLAKGVVAIGVLTAVMGGLIAFVVSLIKKLQESSKDNANADPNSILYLLLGFAALILVIGFTIKKLSPVMAAMAVIPVENLLKGVVPIIAIFAIIGLMMFLATKNTDADFKSLAVIFIAIAAIFFICYEAITKIIGMLKTDQDMTKLLAAVFAMFFPLLVAGAMVIIVGEMLKKVPQAAEMIANIALMIAACAGSIWVFSTINDWDNVWNGIKALAAIAFIIAVLGAIVGGIPIIQTGLEALGAVALSIGGGIFLVAVGLAILMALSKDFDKSGKDLCNAIIAVGEALGAALPGLILGFIAGLIDGLARGLGESIRVLAQLILDLIVGIIDFLYENSITIGAAVGRLLAALAVIIATALVTFVADLWQAFKDAIGWNSPIPGIVKFGMDLVASAVSGLVKKTVAITKWFKERIKSAKEAFKKAKETVEEFGTNLIMTFLNGIVQAWKSVTEWFNGVKETVTGVFKTVKEDIQGVWDEITNGSDNVTKKLEENTQRMKELNAQSLSDRSDVNRLSPYKDDYDEQLAKLKSANDTLIRLNKKYQENWKAIQYDPTKRKAYIDELNRIKTDIYNATAAIQGIYEAAEYSRDDLWQTDAGYTFINGAASAGKTAAEYLMQGFNTQIVRELGVVDKSMDSLTSRVKDGFKYGLGIASPSKVFMQYAKFMIEGLNIGLKEEEPKTQGILSSFAESISSFDTDIESPTITPVLDLTEIQNGANQISAMMSNQKAQVLASMDIKRSDVRNGERLNDLTEAVNHLTIKTDSMDISGELGVQSGLLGQIIDALANQNVVLDSGALVGGITTKMDKALGARSIAVGRRAY